MAGNAVNPWLRRAHGPLSGQPGDRPGPGTADSAPGSGVPDVIRRTRTERGKSPTGPKARTTARTRARDEKYAAIHQADDESDEQDESQEEGQQRDGSQPAPSAEQIQAQALQDFGARSTRMEFSNTDRPPLFDEDNWLCFARYRDKKDNQVGDLAPLQPGQKLRKPKGAAEIEFVYQLKGDREPSAAVQAIFDQPERWALDCIDFVVAARLYAELKVAGTEAFNGKYRNLGTELDPQPMRMDQHQTPGLRTDRFWERGDVGEEFEEAQSPDGEGPTGDGTGSGDSPDVPRMTGVRPSTLEQEDEFLATLPVGTRVMWSTTSDLAEEDWVNENTLKAGPDAYIAHPHGILSAAAVRAEMVPESISDKGAVEIRKHIAACVFIAEVEWYTAPRH